MKKRLFITLFGTALIFSFGGFASTTNTLSQTAIGVVSFKKCIETSKQGKAEQAAFETLKNQMTSVLDKTEKEIDDLSKKLQDSEYLDSLSPDAEQEMQNRYEALSQELVMYQNQYYQILNQANMKVMQTMASQVTTASQTIAKNQGLNLIINEDACFYFNPDLEITPLIVGEMDKDYNNSSAPQTPSTLPSVPSSQTRD